MDVYLSALNEEASYVMPERCEVEWFKTQRLALYVRIVGRITILVKEGSSVH